MNWSFTKKTAIIMLIIGMMIGLWVLLGGGYMIGKPLPDATKAKELQPFITALVTPLFTLGSALLVLENLRSSSLQNFSNNFFKLIDQHHKLVDNINTWIEGLSSEANPCRGRTFFDELAEKIACDYYYLPYLNKDNNVQSCDYPFSPAEDINVGDKTGKEKLIHIYDHYFHIHQSELSHYFRNLYYIVHYADRAPFSFETQRELWTSISSGKHIRI